MNKLKYVSAVIFVKDIEVSKDFYMNTFDQEIEYDFGKNVIFKSGLAIWEIKKGHEISHRIPSDESRNKISSFELYFETEELGQVISLIEKNNIEKFHELKEESWGQRTIRVFDPDHHLIEIGESLGAFVKRMSKTMSPEEVSIKSGISVEDIKILLK